MEQKNRSFISHGCEIASIAWWLAAGFVVYLLGLDWAARTILGAAVRATHSTALQAIPSFLIQLPMWLKVLLLLGSYCSFLMAVADVFGMNENMGHEYWGISGPLGVAYVVVALPWLVVFSVPLMLLVLLDLPFLALRQIGIRLEGRRSCGRLVPFFRSKDWEAATVALRFLLVCSLVLVPLAWGILRTARGR